MTHAPVSRSSSTPGPVRLSRVITAVDAHAGGEPGRVITGGVLDVPGDTVFQKKLWLEAHGDHLRRLMLKEPRGYPALCCNLVLPPVHPEADAAFIIMEQVEYPPMSGSNTICVATVLIETGMVEVTEPMTHLTLEAPAGLVNVAAKVRNGKVQAVTFRNVPAFAVHLDEQIDVPSVGPVTVDVAYGGMFYVIVDSALLGVEIIPENGAELARLGEIIKAAARDQLPVVHPGNPDIRGITIAQITGPPRGDAHARNAVVVSSGRFAWDEPRTWTGSLDRSPCGTGTCARMAVLHAKGALALNREFRHESVLGTVWTGRLLEETDVAGVPAVVPEITGTAWITGMSQYVLDPDDPFPEGFTVGDLWA